MQFFKIKVMVWSRFFSQEVKNLHNIKGEKRDAPNEATEQRNTRK
jgi:hypothetical protein